MNEEEEEPKLVAAIDPILPLLLLACPIGMGLMMWFMSKSMRSSQGESSGGVGSGGTESLAELKVVQPRLAAQIDSASEHDSSARTRSKA